MSFPIAQQHGCKILRGIDGLFRYDEKAFFLFVFCHGIRYKAWRGQGRYCDSICCEALFPESLKTGLPLRRERLLRWLRRLLPVAVAAMVLGALALRGRM